MARPLLQKRSKSWRLSTDTMQVSDWWRNTRNFSKKTYENLETRVAAESESYIHAIRFDFLLGVGTTDAERANHLESSCPQGAATQVEILG